jgi:hypothetical protein
MCGWDADLRGIEWFIEGCGHMDVFVFERERERERESMKKVLFF